MKINLLTISQKSPAWVASAYQEYAKRLPAECSLKIIEIPTPKRSKQSNISQLKQEEGSLLLKAVPKSNLIVALDQRGEICSTLEFAQRLKAWSQEGQDISLLIGGPDGLSTACLDKASWVWSLSRLTFPHQLVRVVLAEQIYRAWSCLQNHPYHRE